MQKNLLSGVLPAALEARRRFEMLKNPSDLERAAFLASPPVPSFTHLDSLRMHDADEIAGNLLNWVMCVFQTYLV